MLYLFEDYTLDTDRRELRRRAALLSMEPQVFDLLVFLVGNRDRVVSKDDLLTAVWGRIVSELTLASRINAARRIIGDSGEQQRLIRTTIGKGVRFVGAVQERQATAEPTISIPPRLSMIVLPFANLSTDPEQQYFTDGITEDLTTDLSRLAGMLVISCNTAFTYRNKQVDTKQIGRELCVRYVLEGSVRRSGNKVRVTAQLIDAETDAHLWAERFDGDTADLFALQDQITSRIAVALNIQLVAAEAARQMENPDALDYSLRGRAMLARPVTRDNRAEVIRLFERALGLDPWCVEAQSWLATVLASHVMIGWADLPATDLMRAEGLARQALAASPHSPSAHIARAEVLRTQRRFAEAIPEYEAVLATNRNRVYALFGLGQCKLVVGSIEETIPLVEQAIRLSPRDPCLGLWYTQIGFVHLLRSRIDDAILWFEKARTAMLEHPSPRGGLASAYALKGDTERAAIELAEARGLAGGDRYSSIAGLRTVAYFGAPKLRASFEATYFEGLRKAGVPEG